MIKIRLGPTLTTSHHAAAKDYKDKSKEGAILAKKGCKTSPPSLKVPFCEGGNKDPVCQKEAKISRELTRGYELR